jgi:hypothetical protein
VTGRAAKVDYHDGMSHGARMTLELILGENRSELLAADLFEELRFRGFIPDQLRGYIEEAHRNSMEEAAERGQA